MVSASIQHGWRFWAAVLGAVVVPAAAFPARFANSTANTDANAALNLAADLGTSATAPSNVVFALAAHDPLQIVDIDQPEDILHFKYILQSPQNNTVFRLPDQSVISKHTEVELDVAHDDSHNSLKDAEEVESFAWPFTNDRTTFWAHQKLVNTETYQEMQPVAISQCLDTTGGQTGSIIVTHSTVIGVNDKAEFGAKLSLGVGFKVVLASALSLSQEYAYTASASVPQGVRGQLFIVKPTIDKSLVSTVVYKVKAKLKKVRQFSTTISTLSRSNPFEYMFITSDKAPLQCSLD